ncbi:hypothetical protein WME89_31720 [Sorangium sp. So ce321]|uniref:hypothetical protein n=1 Tax=Sorangium sp. So ce321 TaxID=3133300 RepID=UPI003F5F8411
MAASTGHVMDLSDSARAFLRARARGDAGWTRRRLTSWMLKRGAPAFHEHIRWEETIAQIVTQERLTPGQGGLLEVGDLRFGSVGLFESQPEWLVERRAGGPYVLVGALANTRARLYLDAHGRLFERRGALWRCVAVSPFVYLERLVAREGERATPWWIEIPGRHGAALGMALSIPRSNAASDELAGTWADGRFCVLDGRADWPSAPATTVLVRAFEAVAELLDALSDLDLPVRISPSGHATSLELSAGEASEPSAEAMAEAPLPASSRQYAAPTDVCDGTVTLRGGALVQEVRDERGVVVERGSFSATGVTLARHMRASEALAARASPEARDYLDAGRYVRDPRRTCSAGALAEALARYAVPALPGALEFEGLLGGLACEPGGFGHRFGTLDMLLRYEENGISGKSTPSRRGGLVVHDAWPRVSWKGRQLVPVGDMVDTRLYVDEGGLVVGHVWEVDAVHPVAAGALTLLEGLAVRRSFLGLRLREVRIDADLGETLGVTLGLARCARASDPVRSFWQGEAIVIWARHGVAGEPAETRIAADRPELLVAAGRAALAAAPEARLRATHAAFEHLRDLDARVERASF